MLNLQPHANLSYNIPMTLKDLHLQNFRNHLDLRLQFPPQTTLILGPNGSGKTNILEAIYLLSTGKSSHADRQEEMISYSADLARVRGVVISHLESNSGSSQILKQVQNDGNGTPHADTQLEILITRGQLNGQRVPPKKYILNGVSKLQKNFVGHLPAVLFGPHDLRLIDGSPSRRRAFLDQLLSQISWEYRRNLVAYEKGLRQRNKLLLSIKEGIAKPQQLLFWNQLLVKNGQLLTHLRQQFIDFLNQFSKEGKGEFSQFSVDYQPSHITEPRLAQYQAKELAASSTLIGPHRDDFIVRIKNHELRITENKADSHHSEPQPGHSELVSESSQIPDQVRNDVGDNSRNLHKFGSRGEQRLAVLWLKLAELSFVKDQTGDTPLLLLDDIFSELDHPHRQLVSQSIKTQQTIITAADEHLVEEIQAEKIILPHKTAPTL
jgi:DNA replication and repair protein RecF